MYCAGLEPVEVPVGAGLPAIGAQSATKGQETTASAGETILVFAPRDLPELR